MSFQHYICQVAVPAAAKSQQQQQQQQQQQSSAPPPVAAAAAAESFSVPFPFEPYSVQRGVAASIRATCIIGSGSVCVLESPTGTGKSQSLLNGVLSHIASVRKPSIASAKSDDIQKVGDQQEQVAASSLPARRDRPSQQQSGDQQQQQPPPLPPPPPRPQQPSSSSAGEIEEEDDVREEQEEERDTSAESLLSRVSAFISEQDRLTKQIKKRRSGVAASPQNDDTAFLVNAASSSSASVAGEVLRCEFDSTSSSSKSSSSDDDDDVPAEDDAEFADAFERLALSVGDSKVIFTSRTHSQLAQIIDELQKGPFRFDATQQQQQQQQPEGTFPVRYLHIGSRQQLCVNDELRAKASRSSGGGGDRLNELCKEATETYRAADRERKRDEKRSSAKKTATAASSKTKLLQQQRARNDAVAQVLRRGAGEEDGSGGKKSDDIEDAASSSAPGCGGCEYADQQRIQQLLRRMMQSPRSITELKQLGRQVKACPFYATRYAVHFSQLLLMPYTYLVDERMRSQMLSGGLRMDDSLSSSSYSGGSARRAKKLKKKQQRQQQQGSGDAAATAAAAAIPWQILVARTLSESRRQKRSGSSSNSVDGGSEVGDDDVSDDVSAILRSSVLVIDEGHNLAESAAAACTASIRSDAIASAVRTIDAYTQHFDSRLLITTKQRLRELRVVLVAWLNFLLGHKMNNGDSSLSDGQQQQQQVQVLGTYGLTSFSFETGTDHVNFFTLVDFLENNDAVTRIGYFGERHFAMEQQRHIAEHGQAISTIAAGGASGGGRVNQEQARQALVQMRDQERQQLEMAREFARFVSPVKALRETLRIAELLARSPERGTVVAVLDEAQPAAADAGNGKQQQPPPLRTLQILGLSPAQAVEPLTRKARATIVAGGTLQPFQLMQMELFPSYGGLTSTAVALAQFRTQQQQQQQQQRSTTVPRPLVVEAFSHVVDPQRFLLFPVSAGADAGATKLRFTRATAAQRPAMLHSVCASLLQLSKIVPRGLVVFFPSFAMEDAFFTALEQSGLRRQIEERKPIFREGDSVFVANKGHSSAADSNKPGSRAATAAAATDGRLVKLRGEELFVEYSKKIEECRQKHVNDPTKGALLVSVMGGKLSEGINFSDDLGRCVMVVGMPYPNLGDPKLQLKLESLKAAAANSSSGSGGEDWSKRYYDALCLRSINQSIGRCIRHVRDYAVVLLMDERFNEVKIARQLPKWMQPRLMMNANFATLSKATTDFFAGFAAK